MAEWVRALLSAILFISTLNEINTYTYIYIYMFRWDVLSLVSDVMYIVDVYNQDIENDYHFVQ